MRKIGAMETPARSAKPKPRDDLAIRPADEPILRSLLRYHLLTAPQVGRLLYAKGALTTAYARLKRLTDGRHIQALDMLRPARRGSGPIVYALGRSGLSHLTELGVDIPEDYRLLEPKTYSYIFLDHAVAVSDVLIAFDLLARAHPSVSVETMLHDRELKRRPVVVSVSGKRVGVVPDAWVRLLVGPPDRRVRLPIAVEVDMGTHERRAWQEKIRAYLAGYGEQDGPLLSAFGVHSLTVGVFTPKGDTRLRELLSWTEAVLSETGNEYKAELFQLSGKDPVTDGAASFLLSPSWHSPLAKEPTPLIPVEPLYADNPRDAARPFEIVNLRQPDAPRRHGVRSYYLSPEAMDTLLDRLGYTHRVLRQEPSVPEAA